MTRSLRSSRRSRKKPGELARAEEQVTRLLIAQEEVTRVLGEPVSAELADGLARGQRPASPIGTVTVPPWQEGTAASVLPQSYQDLLEAAADAGRPLRAGELRGHGITAASKKASRLAREHGITRLVLAETTARQETTGGPDAHRRAAALALASPALDPGHPDTAEAAAYLETVKVAAALLRTPGALPGGPE
jgi:hypothetical protein